MLTECFTMKHFLRGLAEAPEGGADLSERWTLNRKQSREDLTAGSDSERTSVPDGRSAQNLSPCLLCEDEVEKEGEIKKSLQRSPVAHEQGV